MSLQFSLYQVMRLLTNQEVDTKRAALMLYALQIAASNLKRLHEETNEITARAEDAEEESLLKMIWKQLQIPEPLEDAMAAVAAQIPDLPTTTASRVSCASPK